MYFQPKDRTKEIKKLEEYKKKAEDAWNEEFGNKSGQNQEGSPSGGEGSGGSGGGGAKSC